MKPGLCVILIVFTFGLGNAQVMESPDKPIPSVAETVVLAKQSVYVEESFILQSVNFETRLTGDTSKLLQVYGRLGLGYFYLIFFCVT